MDLNQISVKYINKTYVIEYNLISTEIVNNNTIESLNNSSSFNNDTILSDYKNKKYSSLSFSDFKKSE